MIVYDGRIDGGLIDSEGDVGGYFRHTPRPAMYKFQADGETLNSGDGPDKYFCTVIPVD